MKKLLALISLLALSTSIASAQNSLSPGVAQQPVPQFSRCNLSIPVNVSTATTTLLYDGTVVGVSALGTHICGFYLQIVSGTSPTFKLVSGTQVSTACDTGAANLTGPFAAAGLFSNTLGAQLNVVANKQICLVSGGTTPLIVGYMTLGNW